MGVAARALQTRKIGFVSAALVIGIGFAAAQTEKPRAESGVARGKVVFADNCGECHNADSKEDKSGPGLQGLKNRKLRNGRNATHDEILDIVNTGPGEMTSFRELLSGQQKEDVVAYVMTL